MQPNNIIDITLDNFQDVMLEQSKQKLVMVEFWSAAFPESEQMAPLMASVAGRHADSLLLARVNCDEQQQIVMQFGVRSVPTVILVKQGQPVDGVAGVQTEQSLDELLAKHLPKPEDELLKQAQQALVDQQFEQAGLLARQAFELDNSRADIRFVLADAYIQQGHIAQAKGLLADVGLVDQNHEYQRLIGLIELAEQAADTPEIQALQAQLQQQPDDLQLKVQLAVQLQQASRYEEALQLLLEVLKVDLNFGDARKFALDTINGLPAGDPLASVYRRKIYSLLY